MSLLMDALNKAEQAKRQGQPAEPAATGAAAKLPAPPLALELTPLMLAAEPPVAPEAAEAPPALPELPDLGKLDQEFIAHAAAAKPGVKSEKPPARVLPPESSVAPPTPTPAAAPTKAATASPKAVPQDREAAQNLFDAKQPAAPRSNKRLLLAIGLIALLAAGAIGVYFWLQLQPAGGLGMAKPAANLPRPLPPSPQPAPAPVVTPAPAAVEGPVVAEPVRPVAAPVPPQPPKTFQVTTSTLKLNPALASGYQAYLAGNYAAARNDYLQVLQVEPSNLDALHGMAAISLREGQPAAAEEYYLRAIEADPKDALAQSGLISLKGQVDPQLAESRLNALLAVHPELPFLHFALGNLYASQNRWSEAQVAFFKAYSGEPDNPDTLFNLAVSLDQLHQSRLAVQYYNQALTAAASRPASFDKTQASARLRELQPQSLLK